MKFKQIKKWSNGDLYIFVGGVAIVPGFRIKGQEVKITLKEFNQMRGNNDESKV